MNYFVTGRCVICGKPCMSDNKLCQKCHEKEGGDKFDIPYDWDAQPLAIVGHCPACGGYLRTVGGNYADQPQYDVCEDCNWMGDVEY